MGGSEWMSRLHNWSSRHWELKKETHIFLYFFFFSLNPKLWRASFPGGCTSSDQSASSAACVLQGCTAPEDRSADRSTEAAFWVQRVAALVTRRWTSSQPEERKVLVHPPVVPRQPALRQKALKVWLCLTRGWRNFQAQSSQFPPPRRTEPSEVTVTLLMWLKLKDTRSSGGLFLAGQAGARPPSLGRHHCQIQWRAVNFTPRPSVTLYSVLKPSKLSELQNIRWI